MRILFAVILFFVAAVPLLAEESNPKFNILIVTGGHEFDVPNFYKVFDDMPDVRYEKAELPKDMDLLAPGLEKKYDLLLTYDMNTFPVSDQQKERFAALIESGMPLLVMHHSLGGYQNWPLYRKMIGGHYLQAPLTVDGTTYPASDYKHDVDMAVQVADKEHPITQGVENFTIHDEAYKNVYVQKGVHVLLTTDHPDSTVELAWTHRYGQAMVFVIALGHDNQAYANPNLPRILRQGIRWCIEQTRKNLAAPSR